MKSLFRVCSPAVLLVILLSCAPVQRRLDPPEPLPTRPNILFLFADDQRADTIGAWGNPHIRTPHIDHLVAEGTSLRNVYCNGSIHGAVCVPSRAMLLSGRSLYRAPTNLAGVGTIPEALAANGYRTFIAGKWHNGKGSVERVFAEGDAVFLGGMCDHTEVPLRRLADGTLGEPVTPGGFSSEHFADAAIAFLRGVDTREGADPFFAYVAFTAPHDPRQPPLPLREEYAAEPPPLPENYLPQHPFDNGWLVGRDENLAGWPRTPEVVRAQLGEYYGMITHLDRQVGRILAALEETGLARDTIVIYTADHGLAVGSHGLLGKQSLYEHSMKAPAIVRGPGIPHGESEALAYLFDLSATVLDLTGTQAPAGIEGRSLVPVLRGQAQEHRTTIATFYEDSQRAVRDERWKLIRYPKVDHEQLFDLWDDPAELQNLATDPAHAAQRGRLRVALEEARIAFGDPHPHEVEEPGPLRVDLTGKTRKPDRWQPDWIVEKYFGE